MKFWVDPQVTVRAWDKPWMDDVIVSTNLYHLIPDEARSASRTGFSDPDVQDWTWVEV